MCFISAVGSPPRCITVRRTPVCRLKCPHASPPPGGLTKQRCVFHSHCASAWPVAALGDQGPGTNRGVGASSPPRSPGEARGTLLSGSCVFPSRATSLPRPRDWAVPQSPRLRGRERGGRAAGAGSRGAHRAPSGSRLPPGSCRSGHGIVITSAGLSRDVSSFTAVSLSPSRGCCPVGKLG